MAPSGSRAGRRFDAEALSSGWLIPRARGCGAGRGGMLVFSWIARTQGRPGHERSGWLSTAGNCWLRFMVRGRVRQRHLMITILICIRNKHVEFNNCSVCATAMRWTCRHRLLNTSSFGECQLPYLTGFNIAVGFYTSTASSQHSLSYPDSHLLRVHIRPDHPPGSAIHVAPSCGPPSRPGYDRVHHHRRADCGRRDRRLPVLRPDHTQPDVGHRERGGRQVRQDGHDGCRHRRRQDRQRAQGKGPVPPMPTAPTTPSRP